jgi:hypothetical protein
MARRLDDEIAGLVDEMQGVRNEFHRLKAIEEAVAVERDSDMLLNERWLSLGPAGAPPGALPASSNCEIASSRYDPQGQGAGGEFRETGSRGARPSSTTKVHFPWALIQREGKPPCLVAVDRQPRLPSSPYWSPAQGVRSRRRISIRSSNGRGVR